MGKSASVMHCAPLAWGRRWVPGPLFSGVGVGKAPKGLCYNNLISEDGICLCVLFNTKVKMNLNHIIFRFQTLTFLST